jgi:hypothetical protein
MHLAPRGDDVGDGAADRRPVTIVLLAELAEGCRIEVEAMNPKPYLTVVQPRIRIESPGGLGEHTARFEHAVQPER